MKQFQLNIGPYLTGPSGYPSPGDPTGMGYMMDGHAAQAAQAMMQARPPGEHPDYTDYTHAAYAQYYGHL